MLVVVAWACKGKSLVAFDKVKGNVLWTALDDKIGYSTPCEVTIDGVQTDHRPHGRGPRERLAQGTARNTGGSRGRRSRTPTWPCR